MSRPVVAIVAVQMLENLLSSMRLQERGYL